LRLLIATVVATTCWGGLSSLASSGESWRERAALAWPQGVLSRRAENLPQEAPPVSTQSATGAAMESATEPASARRNSVLSVLTPMSRALETAGPDAAAKPRADHRPGSRIADAPGAAATGGSLGRFIAFEPATTVMLFPQRERLSQGRVASGETGADAGLAPVLSLSGAEIPPQRTTTQQGRGEAFGSTPFRHVPETRHAATGLQFAASRLQADDPARAVEPSEVLPPLAAAATTPPRIFDPLQIAGRPRSLREIQARIQPPTGLLPTDAREVLGTPTWTLNEQQLETSRSQLETIVTWEAPASCHKGLLFEEPNLERHGRSIGLFQPALSAAHFFGRVPALPYLALSERASQVRYTLGHHRPGSEAPLVWHIPRPSLTGGVLEATTIVGVLYAFP